MTTLRRFWRPCHLRALDSEISINQKLADDIEMTKRQYDGAVRAAVAAAATYQSLLPNYGQNQYRDAANLQEVNVDTMRKQQPKFQAALNVSANNYKTARAAVEATELDFFSFARCASPCHRPIRSLREGPRIRWRVGGQSIFCYTR
jgi:hypothetical protein